MSEEPTTRIVNAVRTSYLQQLAWLKGERDAMPVSSGPEDMPLIAAILTLTTVLTVSRSELVAASNNIYDAISLLKTKDED